ncbi:MULTISPECIES: helix-turn-helix domain-containing protein [unclassified Microcoleus]|uniref:helix-turn-helix domain-containing protein n=1 Tax=unclassified Microcoleus TaxID=2642155 RepID=UPI00404074A3
MGNFYCQITNGKHFSRLSSLLYPFLQGTTAYSIDLRQKILSAWQNKEGTQRELAKRFKVSLSFLRDFLRRYRETGEIAGRTLLRRSPLEA